MGMDRWFYRSPEGLARTARAREAGLRCYQRTAPPAARVPETDHYTALADQAFEAALAAKDRTDPTFGAYASLSGFLHSCAMQEARLLELAIAQAAGADPTLRLLTPKRMPIVASAQEMLERTAPDAIKGIRFPSRAYAKQSYRPDLFIADQVTHTGLIIDVKRSLGTRRPNEIEDLRFRMLAAASSAGEWIAERRGPVLVEVQAAVIDGADKVSDHDNGIWRLSEIDQLLAVEGAAASVARTRAIFAEKVQAELARRCGALLGKEQGAIDGALVAAVDPEGPPRIVDGSLPPHREAARGSPRFGYARPRSLH